MSRLPEPSAPFWLALSLVGACLVLVLFAVARTRVQRMRYNGGKLFRRPDETGALLSALRVPVRDDEAYLQEAVELLGQFVSAPAWISLDASAEAEVFGCRLRSGLRCDSSLSGATYRGTAVFK